MASETISHQAYASAGRTTSQTGTDMAINARSLLVILDVTDVTAGPSITVTIQGKDPVSGKYYTLLAGAAVVTAVTNVYRISPHLTAAANAIAQDVVPSVVRVNVAANNANNCIYSIGVTECV